MKHRDMAPEDLLNKLVENSNENSVESILLSEAVDGKSARLKLKSVYNEESGKFDSGFKVEWSMQGEYEYESLEMGVGVNLLLAIKVYQKLLALICLHTATKDGVGQAVLNYLLDADNA